MTTLSLPFPRSYVVVPGRLLAGCYPGDCDPEQAREKVAGLARCGVTHVINLMERDERDRAGRPFADYTTLLEQALEEDGRELVSLRHPIVDLNVPSAAAMRRILDAIDKISGAGHVVYVHCWGGRGRTGTVIGCYLARHGIATGQAAVDHLAALTAHWRPEWGPTPETTEQRRFVREWRAGE